MTAYFPLEKLRKIKGLESAKYIDPYANEKANTSEGRKDRYTFARAEYSNV